MRIELDESQTSALPTTVSPNHSASSSLKKKIPPMFLFFYKLILRSIYKNNYCALLEMKILGIQRRVPTSLERGTCHTSTEKR